MTYQNIYTAVQNIRFNSTILSTDGGIKDWIKAREEEVWEYAPWPLKESGVYSVTVTTNSIALPTAFTEFTQEMEVYDDLGQKIEYLSPTDFAEQVASYTGNVPSGNPSYWTIRSTSSAGVVTAAVNLDKNKNGATFTVQGWSGPVCRSSTSAYKLGTMSANSDLPWWDTNHFFLVSGTVALGKQLQSDPSWQGDEQAFQSGLQRLEKFVLGSRRPIAQWSGKYSNG